jgi:hypothetical protein
MFDDDFQLCFDLEIDYEVLGGGNKADKVRELLAYVERYKLQRELVAYIRKQRPNIEWS